MSDAKKLLVIDDEEGICDLICFVGENLGFASAFITHTDHFEKINVNHFDVIFLDLMMPDIDGIQILRLLSIRHCEAWLVLMSGMDQSLLETAKTIAEEHGLNVLKTLNKTMRIDELETLLSNLPVKPASEHATISRQQTSRKELEKAIENREIIPFFQPKIDLKNKKVIGVEALARWICPDSQKIILPDSFIALAEQENLIKKLSEVIIEQSLKQCAEWQHINSELFISINLSTQVLSELSFPDWLYLKTLGNALSPSQVILEIVESSVFENIADSLDTLTRLRLKGFKLSIDDFGTGYSSMKQLTSLPFTELKIDQAFVKNADTEEEARIICQTAIELGHKLDMSVIAEGIETESVWNLLKGLGCNEGQGYYMGKAMPPEEFERWHQEWAAS